MTLSRTLLERLTKPAIVVSLVAAASMQAWVIELPTVVASAFVVAWTAGRFRPALARRIALFATYLAPAAFVIARGRFAEVDAVVWAAIVCGLMLATPAPMRWSLPEKWKLPLVYWGVLAACTWPLIILREADFHPQQVALSAGWAATVAMGVMVGILWFDWLFSTYRSADDPSLETEILLPLGLGWLLAASIGIYQMFGDMTFLNPGSWANLQRATGLFGDANVFGVISAMWGPALVAIAFSRTDRWCGWWLPAIGLPLSWLATWASGSRSSLPLVLLGLVGVLAGAWRSTRLKWIMWGAAGAIVVVTALGGAAVASGGTLAVGPLTRFIRDFAPHWSAEWAGQMATRLWTREGYGTVAIEMIRQFPLVGVGLSAYYDLLRLFDASLRYDNAQNWYRHELAELGVLGSLGWLVWTGSFLFLLLTARARPARQLSGTVIRLVLVGFGLISLLGVPGQSTVVAFTFWTLAFWFLRDTATGPEHTTAAARPSTLAWVALWLLVFAHTAGTAYVGWTALRPPVRAQRAGVDYFLGVYLPEGNGGSEAFRWAKQRAVAVVPAPTPWMELTVRVNHIDLERKPVDVKVWIDRTLTLRTRLRTVQPVTRYIRSPAGTRIMIETWVSRVHSPEPDVTDRRERGLLLRWNFVEAPPPDAIIAGS